MEGIFLLHGLEHSSGKKKKKLKIQGLKTEVSHLALGVSPLTPVFTHVLMATVRLR
jgi:hypothetical protein